jgi:hypothetical protein
VWLILLREQAESKTLFGKFRAGTREIAEVEEKGQDSNWQPITGEMIMDNLD